jgi:D-inositol-3-phosphate glycosyltransferase
MLSIHSDPIGVLGTRDTGGMSVYIRELAGELGKSGHQIDIYTRSQEKENLAVTHLYENVRLIHLGIPNGHGLSKLAMYPFLPKYFRAIENYRLAENLTYDIIHSHYWLSGQLGNMAQKLWECPHLTTFHTLGRIKNQTGVGQPEPEFRIAAEKEIVQNCQRIFAPTARERRNLIQFYNAPSDKINIVPCGVNLKIFNPMPKADARRRLGLNPSDTILLYIGRFDPLKGLGLLLEAIPYLADRHRTGLVIVGGDGDESAEYQVMMQKIKKLGIEQQVIFAGQRDQHDLPPFYSAADVLVMPSSYESFGLVGLEAMACGRPVVSTAVGAVDSLIRRSNAGCVVDDPTPRSLAAGIRSVVGNPAIPSAKKIRKSILEYSWPNVAAAVIAEYESAICMQYYEEEERIRAQGSC